ncbi:MAG: hypothetical protein CR997_07215 [Acidobacteria bacterium]|nr:MAG: hypothetical protein CR997_07215 [Acidobacteriota bacterium]
MKIFNLNLIFTVCALIVLAVFWLAWIPNQESIHQNQASRFQEETLILEKNSQALQAMQQALDRFAANKEAIAQFRGYLSRNPFESLRKTSAHIEKLARKNRMELTRVVYQKGTRTGAQPRARSGNRDGNSSRTTRYSGSSELISYEIELPLTGTYRDFRRFLLDLQKQEQLTAVHEIRVDSKDDSGLLSIQLGLTSYFTQGADHE